MCKHELIELTDVCPTDPVYFFIFFPMRRLKYIQTLCEVLNCKMHFKHLRTKKMRKESRSAMIAK